MNDFLCIKSLKLNHSEDIQLYKNNFLDLKEAQSSSSSSRRQGYGRHGRHDGGTVLYINFHIKLLFGQTLR